jgi:hypothetical protein
MTSSRTAMSIYIAARIRANYVQSSSDIFFLGLFAEDSSIFAILSTMRARKKDISCEPIVCTNHLPITWWGSPPF